MKTKEVILNYLRIYIFIALFGLPIAIIEPNMSTVRAIIVAVMMISAVGSFFYLYTSYNTKDDASID